MTVSLSVQPGAPLQPMMPTGFESTSPGSPALVMCETENTTDGRRHSIAKFLTVHSPSSCRAEGEQRVKSCRCMAEKKLASNETVETREVEQPQQTKGECVRSTPTETSTSTQSTAANVTLVLREQCETHSSLIFSTFKATRSARRRSIAPSGKAVHKPLNSDPMRDLCNLAELTTIDNTASVTTRPGTLSLPKPHVLVICPKSAVLTATREVKPASETIVKLPTSIVPLLNLSPSPILAHLQKPQASPSLQSDTMFLPASPQRSFRQTSVRRHRWTLSSSQRLLSSIASSSQAEAEAGSKAKSPSRAKSPTLADLQCTFDDTTREWQAYHDSLAPMREHFKTQATVQADEPSLEEEVRLPRPVLRRPKGAQKYRSRRSSTELDSPSVGEFMAQTMQSAVTEMEEHSTPKAPKAPVLAPATAVSLLAKFGQVLISPPLALLTTVTKVVSAPPANVCTKLSTKVPSLLLPPEALKAAADGAPATGRRGRPSTPIPVPSSQLRQPPHLPPLKHALSPFEPLQPLPRPSEYRTHGYSLAAYQKILTQICSHHQTRSPNTTQLHTVLTILQQMNKDTLEPGPPSSQRPNALPPLAAVHTNLWIHPSSSHRCLPYLDLSDCSVPPPPPPKVLATIKAKRKRRSAVAVAVPPKEALVTIQTSPVAAESAKRTMKQRSLKTYAMTTNYAANESTGVSDVFLGGNLVELPLADVPVAISQRPACPRATEMLKQRRQWTKETLFLAALTDCAEQKGSDEAHIIELLFDENDRAKAFKTVEPSQPSTSRRVNTPRRLRPGLANGARGRSCAAALGSGFSTSRSAALSTATRLTNNEKRQTISARPRSSSLQMRPTTTLAHRKLSPRRSEAQHRSIAAATTTVQPFTLRPSQPFAAAAPIVACRPIGSRPFQHVAAAGRHPVVAALHPVQPLATSSARRELQMQAAVDRKLKESAVLLTPYTFRSPDSAIASLSRVTSKERR